MTVCGSVVCSDRDALDERDTAVGAVLQVFSHAD
jgi:hypothetical protein